MVKHIRLAEEGLYGRQDSMRPTAWVVPSLSHRQV